MDSALLTELLDHLDRLAADEGVRVLVFSTTSERALSAGADVGEELDAAGGVARMELFARMYAAVVVADAGREDRGGGQEEDGDRQDGEPCHP